MRASKGRELSLEQLSHLWSIPRFFPDLLALMGIGATLLLFFVESSTGTSVLSLFDLLMPFG